MTVPPDFDAGFRDRLAELIEWRRDTRHFRRDPIDEALLGALLRLADTAPSVGLSQPWRFVRVDDAGRRDAIRAIFAACNAAALARQNGDRAHLYATLKLAGLDAAPVHLAVFADPAPVQGHGLGRQTMPETVSFSAVLAIHTLWLAARASGIGLGWVSILDADAVAAALDVPGEWRLVAYLCLGHPATASLTPELEERGWEQRRPATILRR